MTKIDITYWEDKLGGRKLKFTTEAFRYGYSVGPKGEWQMLIANETKEVHANKIVEIRIEDVEVPERAIVLPCFIARHALGFVPSLISVGKPKRVEQRRIFNQALFYPIADGTIHKGELIGVVNILYATPEYKLTREALEKWLSERYGY